MIMIIFLHSVELVFTRLAPLPVRMDLVLQVLIDVVVEIQDNVNVMAVVLRVSLEVFLFGIVDLVEPNREVQ